jgi:HPt (histidine-containing phosphotransfer) domain-containing protein
VPKPFTVETLLSEIARVMGEQQFLSFDEATPDPAPQRFGRALEGLDGDLDLFAEVAVVAINSFSSAATRLEEQAQSGDFDGLSGLAHQLKSNWALYADAEYADLPDLLMSAVRKGNEDLAIKLAAHFSVTLADTAQALGAWLEQHEKVANA